MDVFMILLLVAIPIFTYHIGVWRENARWLQDPEVFFKDEAPIAYSRRALVPRSWRD